MIGLLEPDEGHIHVDGTDITQLDAAALNDFRRRFGMLFQNAALFDSLSVEDNIAFPLREHTDKSPKRDLRDRQPQPLPSRTQRN